MLYFSFGICEYGKKAEGMIEFQNAENSYKAMMRVINVEFPPLWLMTIQ
jgi:hypothetical protein